MDKSRVLLNDGQLQFYCGCGARAELATTAESATQVFGYVCSKDGHAVTDFGGKEDLAQFHEYWRGQLRSA